MLHLVGCLYFCKEGCLLYAGKNNGVENFESHSVPPTNEELLDQKYKEAQWDERDKVSDDSSTVNCMREFWSKTDEAAACFRCCAALCYSSAVVKNELAGVFKMFRSKNASLKTNGCIFLKMKTNQRISYVRQVLPVSSWHPEEEVKIGSRCYYRFRVLSLLHHPIPLHHSSPFSSPLSSETCMLERKIIKFTSTLIQHKLKIVSFSYCLLVKSTERKHKPDRHRPKVALFLWVENSPFKALLLQRRLTGISWQRPTVNTVVCGRVRLRLDICTLGTVYWGYVGQFGGLINVRLESDREALHGLLSLLLR